MGSWFEASSPWLSRHLKLGGICGLVASLGRAHRRRWRRIAGWVVVRPKLCWGGWGGNAEKPRLACPASDEACVGMVRGTNTMWLLMAFDGQVCAKGMTTPAGVLKHKLHTLAMGRQTLNRISWKLKWWT
ncbi:PREDICTED: uncharacterized protein LOC106801024 [Ceratotherium simum simum]|uniref:Uncharacterized protein LOC106801024 n=1 Tax=Ceratotherium simum simum TaxID=73337 RepID=A0ABM1CH58_CERSS|nr:PREDICTED: uncharacterized protein LOC106801024 [Ceratotherium simum simum]XP_014638888.1 PREDICTED: uncharacterized protein LOC106801024 [Ceratotherium simum simum]XP_014638889.1 PREDICTED: uncharacterized protein LOC106801024 [Ceratotherium simum simum]